jgi:hypothetical protein
MLKLSVFLKPKAKDENFPYLFQNIFYWILKEKGKGKFNFWFKKEGFMLQNCSFNVTEL